MKKIVALIMCVVFTWGGLIVGLIAYSESTPWLQALYSILAAVLCVLGIASYGVFNLKREAK